MVICVTRMFDVLSLTFDFLPPEFDANSVELSVISLAFDSILSDAYSISVEADSNFSDQASGKIEADSTDVAAVCFRGSQKRKASPLSSPSTKMEGWKPRKGVCDTPSVEKWNKWANFLPKKRNKWAKI